VNRVVQAGPATSGARLQTSVPGTARRGASTSAVLSGITRLNEFPDKGALKGRTNRTRTRAQPASAVPLH
jgi:hypothetical protein